MKAAITALLLALSAPALASPYSFIPLTTPAGTFQAGGLNNAGQVIGTFTPTSQPAAHADALYTNGDLQIGSLSGSITPTQLTGLNNAGTYTGFEINGTIIAKTPNSFTGKLGTPRTPITSRTNLAANALNDANQIVGTQLTIRFPAPATTQGFLRQPDGTLTTFSVPGATNTEATGINNPGAIVGTAQSPGTAAQGYLLSNGAFTTFTVPGALSTMPTAINDAGAIAGTYTSATGASQGFLYVNGTFTDLLGPDGRAFLPTGLNNPGQLIGQFANDPMSYLATPQPIPEPPTLALFAAGLAALLTISQLRPIIHRPTNS